VCVCVSDSGVNQTLEWGLEFIVNTIDSHCHKTVKSDKLHYFGIRTVTEGGHIFFARCALTRRLVKASHTRILRHGTCLRQEPTPTHTFVMKARACASPS
jgi:hypothetical protein